MVALNIKALCFGVITGFLGFAMLQTEFVNNLFTLILVSSVISGNFYILLVGRPFQ